MLAQVVDAPSASLGELGPGVLGSTLAVLLLLVATLLVLRVAYGYKRGRPRLYGPGGPLAVIAQVELAAGQSLYLVRAAGRCLLIGATSGVPGSGLGLIAELDPAQVEAQAAALPSPEAGTLAQRLRQRFFGTAELPAWASELARAAQSDRATGSGPGVPDPYKGGLKPS